MNHYFQDVLYCIPEDYEKEIPNKFTSHILTYEKIFYGPWNKKTERSACFPNICIEKAFVYAQHQNLRVKAYLLKGDDTFLLHKKGMFDSNFDKVWLKKDYMIFDTKTRCHNEGGEKQPSNCGRSWWDTWHYEDQIIGSLLSLRYLKISKKPIHQMCSNILKNKLGTDTRLYYQPGITDFLYIPANLVEQYIELMEPFIFNHIIFETALPNVLECLLNITNTTILNVKGFNHRSNEKGVELINNPHNILLKSFHDDLAYLHGIKLSGMVLNINYSDKTKNQKFSSVLHAFCSDIIPYIIS